MNAFNSVEPWWEKREDEPNIEPYVERTRDDGEGSLRVGQALTFREDMYNMAYVLQVKRMYNDACEAENEENEKRINRAKINLLGEEPKEVEEFEEEDVPEEAGEDEDFFGKEFGISQYLVVIPFLKLHRCYKVWKYGEEHVKEEEQVEVIDEVDFDEYVAKRANLLARACFLFMTQGMLAALVMSEIIYSDPEVWTTFAGSQWIVFSRFMCGIVLHVSLSGEMKQGLINMKYAVNHPWKFVDYKIAWFCGFMQAFNVLVVELVNFSALLTNFTIIDIIMNFLALVVIAEFDEYFFSALNGDPLVDIITGDSGYENFLIIQRTTSE